MVKLRLLTCMRQTFYSPNKDEGEIFLGGEGEKNMVPSFANDEVCFYVRRTGVEFDSEDRESAFD